MLLFGLAKLLLILSFGLVLCIIPAIFFILTMQKALQRCAPENQTMSPVSTWLLLIPVFNLAWDFIIVTQIANSLEREFKRRNIPVEPAPGKSIGLAWCILTLCALIPFLGILCAIAGFICWILYWVKIANFSASIAAPYAALAPAH